MFAAAGFACAIGAQAEAPVPALETASKLEREALAAAARDVSALKHGPKADLSTFRVKSKIATDVHTLFALFMKTNSIPSWAFGVSEAKLLGRLTDDAELLYLYSDTPWPVRDRDMVVVRVSEAAPDGQSYRIVWHCLPDSTLYKRKNVVHIRACHSEFLLRRVDDQTSHLEYRVGIDPAGSLPNWARKWFAKTAPEETLARIIQRVEQLNKKKQAR